MKSLNVIRNLNRQNQKEKSPSLYTIAKYTNRELLLESLLQSKGSYKSLFLENYKKNQRTFKIKVIATKILYSLVFGILPIILVLNYLEIIEGLGSSPLSSQNIILTGIIFFALYFGLQFFNFVLMGILESSMVMSGIIFRWFETLPISRHRLKRLAYFTIFRTFDIPIIIIVLGFPITMLIQTQNVLLFLVSLIISLINILFSFDLLIMLGARLHGILYASPKKTLIIRLFNIISYVAVILGSIYLIQWIFSSLDDIFLSLLDYEQAPITNVILSIIPFPFNPSYLLFMVITPSQISLFLWISIFVGLGLFILITYMIHMRTSRILSKITTSSLTINQKTYIKKEKKKEKIPVKIRTFTPVVAFLRKDLSIITHDVKVFLSLIMPIILSCIFTFSFNIGNIDSPIIMERDIITYFLGILIFSPIISGMIVYGLSSIDISGETILAALPINHRDRANAKLRLMIILQTLALFCPNLLYILSSRLPIYFFTTVLSLPFMLIFLIFTFELKIYYFNKFKNRYVLEDVNPQNRIFKWTLIVCIQYSFVFWMLSFVLVFYINLQFDLLQIFYIFTIIISIIIGTLIFSRMFPIRKEEFPKITRFTRHTWISIVLIFVLSYLNVIYSNFFFAYLFFIDIWWSVNLMTIIGVILFNLSFIPLFFIMFPRILGVPNGKQLLDQYLVSVKANWLKPLLKALGWVILGILLFYIIYTTTTNSFYQSGFEISFDGELISFILNSSILFWQELLFRGIILTMLLKKRKKSAAIVINASLILIFLLITQFSVLLFDPDIPEYFALVENTIWQLIIIFFNQIVLAFLFVKTQNIFPGIILQLLMMYINLPIISTLL
ncbi:MAG: type II CAAX prenyl endopeptidase Rce1 family protein [Promethearchaeota archaeon]